MAVPAASMRPGRKGPRYRVDAGDETHVDVRFNEAGAQRPQIYVGKGLAFGLNNVLQ